MKKSLVLLLSSLLLISCSGQSKSNYDPYSSRADEDISNRYETPADEFHISHWYSSDFGQSEIEDNGDEVKVSYTKNIDYEYSNIFTTVIGRFADFEYINFRAKGTPGKGVTFRLYYGKGDSELNNVLGNDVSFSLANDYQVYSLKVKNTYKTRMDLLSKVCIFPEIGLANTSGTFYFTDVWFSKTMPEGASWENQGVDTGDSSITVNGWRTEAWTQYTLYSLGGDKTGVRYSKAAEYAFIEKKIEIKDGDNAFHFDFENVLLHSKQSITSIRFLLRGDVYKHVDVKDAYDLYYESMVYHYDLTKSREFMPDENNITHLAFSIVKGVEEIGEHHVNGYRLTLLIESHPEDDPKYKSYRDGQMVIHNFESCYDEHCIPDENDWSTPSWCSYTISKEETGTRISYLKNPDYAITERALAITEEFNGLNFNFENVKLHDDLPSVTCIRFYIRGDVSKHVEREGESYDLYYEKLVYQYDLTDPSEVQEDENGLTKLSFSLAGAIEEIGPHHLNGYRLTLMIESHPDDKEKYASSLDGEIFVKDVELIYNPDFKLPDYELDEDSNRYYSLHEKEGVECNVKYNNVPGNAFYPRLRRRIVSEHDSIIVVTIKNNATHDVLINVRAGINNDERSTDEHHFYPLWKVGLNGDGDNISVEPNETYELYIQVDREGADDEAIDSIFFMIDNCRKDDTTKRSGDIDFVSVEIN